MVKASDQITIIDTTDAYTITLSSDSYTFSGDTDSVDGTQTTTTQITAFRGDEQVPVVVGTIESQTGISAVSDGKTPAPTVTITATSELVKSGTLVIPITVNNDISINKKFSYSIALKGADGKQGPKGEKGDPGTDALTIVVSSSNGVIFNNGPIHTTLTAQVFRGIDEITGDELATLGKIAWFHPDKEEPCYVGNSIDIHIGIHDIIDPKYDIRACLVQGLDLSDGWTGKGTDFGGGEKIR